MASASGISSGSTQFQNSGYEEGTYFQQGVLLDDQRKRKRMILNRESARRSRLLKQKHLDHLVAQACQLRSENNHIATNMKVPTQLFLNMDAENSVLRAQLAKLTHRLDSLHDIIDCLNSNSTDEAMMCGGDDLDDFFNPWSLLHVNQTDMTSADMFMH